MGRDKQDNLGQSREVIMTEEKFERVINDEEAKDMVRDLFERCYNQEITVDQAMRELNFLIEE